MIGIGTALGLGASLASSIIGGRKAARARKRQMGIYADQLRQARANGLRYANEDYTQTAPAQAAVEKARQLQQDSMAAARGADAVTGGRSQRRAAAQNAASNAQLASQLAAAGHSRQEAARQLYDGQARGAQNTIAGMYGQQAEQTTQAANQGMQAGLSLAQADRQSIKDTGVGVIEDMFGFNKKRDQY